MNRMQWIVGLFLFICGIQDIREKQIYVYPVIVAGAFVIGYQLMTGVLSVSDWVGGMAVGGVLCMISIISRGQIGLGDAMLFCLTGLTVGFGGNIQILFYSFLFAAVLSGYLVFVHHKKKKHTLPFVPCLFLGYCLVAAYGL